MKILYDYQAVTMQTYGGISRLFYVLAVKLKEKKVKVMIPALLSKNHYFRNIGVPDYGKNVTNPFLRKAIIGINQKLTGIIVKYGKVDIFHSTYYDLYWVNNHMFDECVKVVTIHDMIPEKFVSEYSYFDELVQKKRKILEAADVVICVSENTKKDLLQIYPDLNSKRVEVVYAVDELEDISEENNIQIPEKYVLFVGNRKAYKNFGTFINAYSQFQKTHQDFYLICVGGGTFTEDERELIKQLDIEKNVIQKEVSDWQLCFLYRHAYAFVFPSLYEGFGLPIIEAFRCDCPVLLANASCFPEVADEAAIYFDPMDSQDITNKLNYIVDTPDIRDEYIQRGRERAEEFETETIVNKLLALYEDVSREKVR